MDGNKVKELLGNNKKFEQEGWYIKKESKFTDSPYGNVVKIDLGEGSIVQEQTEYLVDFEELKRKLKEKNILLSESSFLLNNNLSLSHQNLTNLYRKFIFKRGAAPVKPIFREAIPMTGNIEKVIKENNASLKIKEAFRDKNTREMAKKKLEMENSDSQEEKNRLITEINNLETSNKRIDSKIKEFKDIIDAEKKKLESIKPKTILANKPTAVIATKVRIKPKFERKIYIFTVKSDLTIKELKEKIKKINKGPTNLKFGDIFLTDENKTLLDYNISNNALINTVTDTDLIVENVEPNLDVTFENVENHCVFPLLWYGSRVPTMIKVCQHGARVFFIEVLEFFVGDEVWSRRFILLEL